MVDLDCFVYEMRVEYDTKASILLSFTLLYFYRFEESNGRCIYLIRCIHTRARSSFGDQVLSYES